MSTHKYNLNDWSSNACGTGLESVSKSRVPMVGQGNNQNYDAAENNDDKCSTTDLRTRLTSWHQNNQQIKYNQNFKMCAEILYAVFLTLILLTFIGSVIGVWYGSQIVLNGIDHNTEDTKENCYLFDYNQTKCYYECNGNEQCEGDLFTYYAISIDKCGNETLISEYKCPSTYININQTITCFIKNCDSAFTFHHTDSPLLAGIVIISVCTGFILIACFAWFKSCAGGSCGSCKVCY
eukprot:265764_1